MTIKMTDFSYFNLTFPVNGSTAESAQSENAEMHEDMLSLLKSLNLTLSTRSQRSLVKGMVQAAQFFASEEKPFSVKVAHQMREGELVPVVHMQSGEKRSGKL